MKFSLLPSLPALDPTLDLLMTYDRILVAFSGGKDSLACVLALLELGVPPERIELHHHLVDGHGDYFMDWPITSAYCQAVADLLGMKLIFSYREGGFYREMTRDKSPTAPTQWQDVDGNWHSGGGRSKLVGTRMKFPQVTADLSVRWCSPYLKIMVMDTLLVNDHRFRSGSTLVVTGERAQESASRAKYAQFEPHRADNRLGQRQVRHIDHLRIVHGWDEAKVWEIIKMAGIIPHPAYRLGFSKLNCRQCVMGSEDQWATIRHLYPEAFNAVCKQEDASVDTIRKGITLRQWAYRGKPYVAAVRQPELAAFANQTEWSGPIFTENWTMPAGAFGENAGPC